MMQAHGYILDIYKTCPIYWLSNLKVVVLGFMKKKCGCFFLQFVLLVHICTSHQEREERGGRK